MSKLRVFISSTMEDFEDEREKLASVIEHNRFWEAVYGESFVARSESPRELCLQEVRNSHIYIGIFKKRYGHVPEYNNPRKVSVVVLEYEEAKKNRLPVFILVCKDIAHREPELEEFLRRIRNFDTGHWSKQYATVDELIRFALDAINYEVTKRAVEAIELKRKVQAKKIYNLPYFRRIMEQFPK